MEQYQNFASLSHDRERADIENLLSEAKSLHERVTTILTDAPAISLAPIRQPEPRIPANFGQGFVTSSQSWEDLFRRGRELDERVQRLRYEVPSPRPLRERVRREEEEERKEKEDGPVTRMEAGKSNDENARENAKVS